MLLFELKRPLLLERHSAPVLSDECAQAVADARARIAEHPHMFDGPRTLCTDFDNGVLQAYDATYAFVLAQLTNPHLAAELGMSLGVVLVLEDENSQKLWVKRGKNVSMEAGKWELGASGGVDPGQTLKDAVVQESVEELGVSRKDIFDVQERFYCQDLAMVVGQ